VNSATLSSSLFLVTMFLCLHITYLTLTNIHLSRIWWHITWWCMHIRWLMMGITLHEMSQTVPNQ
jgi:hypothetical protein